MKSQPVAAPHLALGGGRATWGNCLRPAVAYYVSVRPVRLRFEARRGFAAGVDPQAHRRLERDALAPAVAKVELAPSDVESRPSPSIRSLAHTTMQLLYD